MNKQLQDNRLSLWDIGIRQISIQNVQFELLSPPKRGGSCLVYEAVKMDFLKPKVILKEFYPNLNFETSDGIARNPDGTLYVPESLKRTSVYQQILQRFLTSCEIMVKLSKEEDSVDHAVVIHSLMEANGTWYVEEAHDFGTLFFDYFKAHNLFPSMARVLDTLGYCMEIVGRLHELGYYHLDLKPNNLSFTKSGIVRFFDTDSFVKISELSTYTDFPVSGGFSAPELYSANDRPYDAPYLIGPWTDIYSLAQFICDYLFGRPLHYNELKLLLPELEQHILFVDYYTDGQCFEKYEDAERIKNGDYKGKPTIPRNGLFLLKMFLLKALSPDISERYHNMEDALKDLWRITDCFYNYKIQLVDNFQEFIPEQFDFDSEMDHLEYLLLGEYAKKYLQNGQSHLVIIISRIPKEREKFAKYYATLNRMEYDSIHEIRGIDIDTALHDLRFFQHGNASVYDALKLAIQDKEHPTLIIFYDEKDKYTEKEAEQRDYYLETLLWNVNHNLHLLIVTKNCVPIMLREKPDDSIYSGRPASSIILPIAIENPGFWDNLYTKLVQYDWFVELTVYVKVLGKYLIGLILIILISYILITYFK